MGDLKSTLSTDHEMLIVCHKGTVNIRGSRDGSVWNFPKVSPTKMIHPTQKPIELIAKVIRKFSDIDDLVLDPFIGSGTTAAAAISTNRNFIGFEIEKEYYEGALLRISGREPIRKVNKYGKKGLW